MTPSHRLIRRLVLFLTMLAIVAGVGPSSEVFGQTPPPGSGRVPRANEQLSAAAAGAQQGKSTDPALQRVGPRLRQLVLAERFGTLMSAAQQAGVAVQGDQVKVTAESDPGSVDAVSAAASRLGGQQTARYREFLDIVLPVAAVPALATTAGVRSVDVPIPAAPSVLSEGVQLINGPAWHNAGINGQGVKVGILDLGFTGYTSRLGTELPSTVDTSCSQQPPGTGNVHGTGVAEIVHDTAPNAQLYLARFTTTTELGNAKDCLINAGVKVINMSVGFLYHAAGDGTGTVNAIVNDAAARGVFWANSSGNYGQNHWSGAWNDSDGDNIHNFSPTDEGQTIQIAAGTTLTVALRWNDSWSAPCKDYNLYIAQGATVIGGSTGVQNCGSGQQPVESFSFSPSTTGTFFLFIERISGSASDTFDLITFGHPLEYQVPAGSLLHPADNASPGMVSTGAVPHTNPTVIEPFSSQGPTTDGRIKPDLTAPDGVSTATYGAGAFFGTSAASPHVAGAAALVRQANPSFGPAQIKNVLTSSAIDLGAVGPDNTFGVGRLHLDPPIPTPPTRFFGTATLNGSPAPNGTAITALLGSTVCGSSTVSGGDYAVDVASAATQAGCGTDGATVRFRIGTATAAQTGTFQTGGFLNLNLTATATGGTLRVQPPAATLPVGTGTPPTTVRIEVAAPPAGLGAWNFTLSYTSAVAAVVSCQGENGSTCNPSAGSGLVRVTGFSASGVTGTVTLATLTLRAASGATAGETSPFTLAVAEWTDPSGGTLSNSTLEHGTLRIGAPDPNGDGSITIVDALCIARQVAALPATAACPVPLPAGDFNGDASTTIVDALCVSRYVAALPATSACPHTAPAAAAASAATTAGPQAAGSRDSRMTAAGPGLLVQAAASPATVAAGSTTTLRLSAGLTGGARLGAWTVDVTYDPTRLTPTACSGPATPPPPRVSTESAASANTPVVCNLGYAPGVVRLTGTSLAGLGDGAELATLTFAVRSTAATGPSVVGVTVGTAATPAGVALPASASSITLALVPPGRVR